MFYVLIKSLITGRKSMTRLIDIDELANYLKLQKQTIYNWLHQGRISGIKVGGVWRFDRREIDNWLKTRRRSARELKSGEKQ